METLPPSAVAPCPPPQVLVTTEPLPVSKDGPVLDIPQKGIIQRGVFCVWLLSPRALTAILPGLAGVRGSVRSTAESYFPTRTDRVLSRRSSANIPDCFNIYTDGLVSASLRTAGWEVAVPVGTGPLPQPCSLPRSCLVSVDKSLSPPSLCLAL